MPRNLTKISTRNKTITEEYTRLFFTEGKRDEVIFEDLGNKYYLQPETVRKIVLKAAKS